MIMKHIKKSDSCLSILNTDDIDNLTTSLSILNTDVSNNYATNTIFSTLTPAVDDQFETTITYIDESIMLKQLNIIGMNIRIKK